LTYSVEKLVIEAAIVVAYRDRHADAFARLNREWLDQFGPPLKLYESLGFQNRPIPKDQPYQTADVCMELDMAELNADQKYSYSD